MSASTPPHFQIHRSSTSGRLWNLVWTPLAIWVLGITLALCAPVSDPMRKSGPKAQREHAKERCRRWEWRLPEGGGTPVPLWRVEAQRAVTIQASDESLEEHLQNAKCMFFELIAPKTLFIADCPTAIYSYTNRTLSAQSISWHVHAPFDARALPHGQFEPTLNTPAGRGTCASLEMRFTRPTPQFDVRGFAAEWLAPLKDAKISPAPRELSSTWPWE